MFFKREAQYSQYRPYIQFEVDEELVAEPFVGVPGILSYLGIGSRLMNDNSLVVHNQTQLCEHWTHNLTDQLLTLGYGSLGAFTENQSALTARHVLDSGENGHIISFIEDRKVIRKTDNLVVENLNVSMQESILLGHQFIGLLGIVEGKLVDAALIGPFPHTFTKAHTVYQPENARKINIKRDHHSWSHKKVKIVGASSGLSLGRVIASSRNVKAKTSVRGYTIYGGTFLVASCNELTGQWLDRSDFAQPGDSGAVVFLDEDEEAVHGLQVCR